MIAQCQRLRHIVWQRFKTTKMVHPGGVIIVREADCCRPTIVTKAQDRLRKVCGPDSITNFRTKTGDLRICAVGGGEGFHIHLTHLGGAKEKGKYGGGSHPAFA